MKTAVIFLVLLATVICHPVRRSVSSSESSEEQVKPSHVQSKPALSQVKAVEDLSQTVPEEAVPMGSDESSDSSDEKQESDTASDDSDDDDEDDSDDSSESDETTEATVTVTPPPATTLLPNINNGRGDNLGYPSDYKSIMFVESNKIQKGPSSYKSYGTNKMEDNANLVNKKFSIYADKDGNDIEKTLKVYKVAQVHEDPTDEDTSTPELETPGLDSSSDHQGLGVNQGVENTEETEETASTSSDSTSASAADGSDSSQSSEETTATPGAVDDDSSQSSESEESNSTEDTSMAPEVITAK